MANPTPSEVNNKTAPAAKPADGPPKDAKAETTAKAPDPAPAPTSAPQTAATAAPAESLRFRVLKAITVDSGQTLMPGDELEIAPDDPSWPARRPKQLVGQKYLRPMNDAARDATRGSDDDG